MNCGDWVESCTALVETFTGSVELLHWSDRRHSVKIEDTGEHAHQEQPKGRVA